MENQGTHVRQKIITAFRDTISEVEDIVSVATASSEVEHPTRGAIADISFLSEKSSKVAGVNMPNQGVLDRILTVAVIASAQVPLDMSAEDFEGKVLGDIERVISCSEMLAECADDWYLSDTEWNYAQDTDASIVSSLLKFTVKYQTSPANPGLAL